MFDFIKDLFDVGKSVFGFGKGGGGGLGGLFGGNNQVFGLGLDIFGGGQGGGGIFSSPVTGHVLSAVGQQLMQPTAEEEAEAIRLQLRAREEERQRTIRSNYGLRPLGSDFYGG